MSTATIDTVTKMLESLPDSLQERALEHLREYLEEITDEMRWNDSFEKTSTKLEEVARSVRLEIASGKSEPMDFDKL